MRLALTLCSGALLFACARGAAGPEPAADAGTFTGAVGAAGATGGTNTGGDLGPGNTTGGDNGGSAAQNTGAESSNVGDVDGGDSGAEGGTGRPGVCPATPAGSCATPANLGQVVGNDEGAPITKTGNGSAWFRLTVTDDSTINGYVETLNGIGVTLTSTDAGANYDVFLYRDGDTSCSDMPFKSDKPTGEDYLDHIWNAEGPIDADPRVLTIEVRQVSSSCGSWMLTIEPHPCSQALAPSGDTCATK